MLRNVLFFLAQKNFLSPGLALASEQCRVENKRRGSRMFY